MMCGSFVYCVGALFCVCGLYNVGELCKMRGALYGLGALCNVFGGVCITCRSFVQCGGVVYCVGALVNVWGFVYCVGLYHGECNGLVCKMCGAL